MWILVVEAMSALGLLLFIVWWTLGPTHRREREALLAEAHAKSDAVAARAVVEGVVAAREDASRDATSTADEGRG